MLEWISLQIYHMLAFYLLGSKKFKDKNKMFVERSLSVHNYAFQIPTNWKSFLGWYMDSDQSKKNFTEFKFLQKVAIFQNFYLKAQSLQKIPHKFE